MRKSFIIHIDSLDILDEMDNEQVGRLFKAIKSYHQGEEFIVDSDIKLAYIPFRNQFDRDNESYQKIVERNRSNGSNGGRPKNPTDTQKTHSVNLGPKKADNDNKNDSKNKSDSKKGFKPPALDEVKLYFKENGYTESSAEKAFNYYSVSDWVDGKGNKVKNWKQKMQGVWFKLENKIASVQSEMDLKARDEKYNRIIL